MATLQNAIGSPIFGNLTTLSGLIIGNGTDAVSALDLTAHSVLVGNSTSAPTQLTVGTDGQMLLGSTGADPVFATLGTANGSGLSATAGAGSLSLALNLVEGSGISLTPSGSDTSITIAVTGAGLAWSAVTGATTLAAGQAYVANSASGALEFTLPASPSLGDTYHIVNGTTNNGWTIAQNASQTVKFLDSASTAGTGGSVSSAVVPGTADANVGVIITYIGSNTFQVTSAAGNPYFV